MLYKTTLPHLLIFNYTNYTRFIKLIAAVLLLFAVTYQSTEYYDFLRVVIFIISIYFFYETKLRFEILKFNKKLGAWDKEIILIVFVILAVFFNPLLPVYLQNKTFWILIDIVGIIVFVSSFFLHSYKNYMLYSIWYPALLIYELELKSQLNAKALMSIAQTTESTTSKNKNDLTHKLKTVYALYTKAIELEPSNPKPHFKRGLLLMKYEYGTFQNAIEDMQNAIRFGEENEYVNLYLGILLLFSFGKDKMVDNSGRDKNKREAFLFAIELFQKQLEKNNTILSYFFIVVTRLLFWDSKLSYDVLKNDNLVSMANKVLLRIAPEEDIITFIWGEFNKYSLADLMNKIAVLLEEENKNFMR